MVNFNYYNPAKIIFGKGTESELVENIKPYGNRVLVHHDDFIAQLPVFSRVMEILKEGGFEIFALGGVVPNPKLSLAYKGIQLCKDENIDFILAIGGGSSIDSSKTIAMGVKHDGDVWDFFADPSKACAEILPMGSVLTIPAAGSESSVACVITQDETNLKRTAYSTALVPKFAVMNPENTFTLPAFQTAAGGFDIMSHLMERYFTTEPDVVFTDKIIEGALKSMIYNLPRCLKDPSNYAYRADIMWCGSNAQSGLFGTGRIGDWASHDIGHELSASFNMAHGASLALATPAWARYVSKENPSKFAQFATEVFGITDGTDAELALKGIEALEAFIAEIGLPVKLSQTDADLSKLHEINDRLFSNRSSTGYYMELSADDITNIVEIMKA